ncbi:M28 family metallopeptidase [Egicoccus halophilus]|uniref:Aminopeptidase n=1 Tax=Egicoccus halophilus TaxID=1670830 RepID=A0A8J3A9N8_9ACTN|nr:M28 family metallopeptidase [Egicoccus halophilus]GGI07740.1 aminopeptidase [Egicoccus halophilus]
MRRSTTARRGLTFALAALLGTSLTVPAAAAPQQDKAAKVAASAAAVKAAPAAAAKAGSAACDNRNNNSYDKLLDCITLPGVRRHLAAFQAIADANDGNRAAGTSGYSASVAYVASQLEAAGYEVEFDEFEFTYVAPAVLQQLSPVSADYETGAFTGSGAGDVTATVTPVDVNVTNPAEVPPEALNSGCEAADFAGFPTGDIALVQRGSCPFGQKAANAEAAGARAMVLFNTGNVPANEGLIVGTLLPAFEGATIPVVGASYEQGVALAQPGSTARVRVDAPETRTDVNVIAELPGANDDNVVMLGAHLDSVQRGPGINDNGSGSAAILETAIRMRKVSPENTVRFAWWGAEELGLIGSREYVRGLSEAERDRIALYLNFDMVGSPNFVRFVYDGDESSWTAPVPVPDGSVAIERLFERYFTWQGLPYEDAEFSGRSDYQEFIVNDIPAGGLFTGAEVVKTPEQAAIWGGTAGISYDPCYHQACDDLGNIDDGALLTNSQAIAFAALTYAFSTEDVNGVPGRRVPGKPLTLPAPQGPEGTVGENAGGLGHDHDHDHEHHEVD